MRISYRQGIISGQENFLQVNEDSLFVDLVVNPEPIVATAAFKFANYLISEQSSVKKAWGPLSNGKIHYLYWEINLSTGKVTRGFTTLPCINLPLQPMIAEVGQMWYDQTYNIMKVYDGFSWNNIIRVFAGSYFNKSIAPQPKCSQVDVNGSFNAGYIKVDAYNNVYVSSDGTFLTSETPLQMNTENNTSIPALANENIPAFSVIYLVRGRAALASSDLDNFELKAPIAIARGQFAQNESVTLATMGDVITDDRLNYGTIDIGKDLYCNDNGGLTFSKPDTRKYVRVGKVISTNSILVTMDWVTEIVLPSNDSLEVNGLAPLDIKKFPSSVSISLTRATSTDDGYISAEDFSRIEKLEHALNAKPDFEHTHNVLEINGLQRVLDLKSNISHFHNISEISNLQDALSSMAKADHTHNLDELFGVKSELQLISASLGKKIDKIQFDDDKFVIVNSDGNIINSSYNFESFAPSNHVHSILDIPELASVLSDKSNLSHTHDINMINGLYDILDSKADNLHTQDIDSINGLNEALLNKSDTQHTHGASDISNFEEILDMKANKKHSHDISWINGLQEALDSKSTNNHMHGIGDISGLNIALSSKSNLNHKHKVDDVEGLRGKLDSKAAIHHKHEITDIVNLQNSLDEKAPIEHKHTLANNLADVDLKSQAPSVGDSLVWNGSFWAPSRKDKFLQGRVFNLSLDNQLADGTYKSLEDITLLGAEEQKSTIWEISATFKITPNGDEKTWLGDDPGRENYISFKSMLDGNDIAINEVENDKLVTFATQRRSITWTQNNVVVIKKSSTFTPKVSVEMLDTLSASKLTFKCVACISLKYIGVE